MYRASYCNMLMWRCVYRASYCNVLMWRCVYRASYCNVLMWRCVYRASYCNELIWRCVYRASYCNVNDQRYAQFLIINFIPKFLSAVHVSNESSRSASGARHNILYYTVWYNRYNRAVSTIVPIVKFWNCTILLCVPCTIVVK